MSYKAGIIEAITEQKERSGSSSISIKKYMQAKLPAGKTWKNATFLLALKNGVASGDLVQNKNSYKLSAEFKKKTADALKPKKTVGKKKAAPKATKKKPVKKVSKKKSTTKKAAPKKKTAPKKKVVTKKKTASKKKSATKKKASKSKQ